MLSLANWFSSTMIITPFLLRVVMQIFPIEGDLKGESVSNVLNCENMNVYGGMVASRHARVKTLKLKIR